MKLWIDDCRPAPQGYIWCNTVNESKILIEGAEKRERSRGRICSPLRNNFLYCGL